LSLEKVVLQAILDITGNMLHKLLQILAHVDAVVIVERYENAVKVAFNRHKMEGNYWFSN
jgi:hypothetical protein